MPIAGAVRVNVWAVQLGFRFLRRVNPFGRLAGASRFVSLSSVSLGLTLSSAAAMGSSFPVEELTIEGLHMAYRERRVSVTDVMKAHVARIAAYDQQGPVLNSIVTLNPNWKAEALEMDRELALLPGGLIPPGLLWGVPAILKDNIDVVGMPMTSGFQGWKHYYPQADAPLAAKMKAAGALILAKASLSEFARGGADNINSVLFGYANNPYHPAYATGGSSGGTGAAIAASFAVVGIGTDTGGSVRMPAAHTALAGLRPTVGMVSRTGMVPLNSIRDTAGPMARTVRDMTILLEVIAGTDPEDTATVMADSLKPSSFVAGLSAGSLKGVRIGVLRQVISPERTDARVLAVFERALRELASAGAEIIDPMVVPELDSIPRPPQTPARFKDDLTKFIAAHPGIPFPSPQEIARSGLLHPLHQPGFDLAADALPVDEDADTIVGRENELRLQAAFSRVFAEQGISLMVFPTWAQLPIRNGDRNTRITDDPTATPPLTGSASSLTFVGSALQWPAISVPMGYVGEGLPVGLQILGPAWADDRVVAAAYAYEQSTNHRVSPPHTPPLHLSLRSRFVGTWKLVAIRDRDSTTGLEVPSVRPPENGQLYYGANGRLSVQIVRQDRVSADPGSSAGFSSYFGRWDIHENGSAIWHHQEGSLNQANVGQSVVRYFSFDALGRLSLATPPRDVDGRLIQSVFVWERVPGA